MEAEQDIARRAHWVVPQSFFIPIRGGVHRQPAMTGYAPSSHVLHALPGTCGCVTRFEFLMACCLGLHPCYVTMLALLTADTQLQKQRQSEVVRPWI